MNVARTIAQGFNTLRVYQNYPTVTIVNPINTWDLPDGYAYDDGTDTIRHISTGDVLNNYSSYWNTTDVDMLPLETGEELRTLIMAGIVKEGSLDILIIPADKTIVQNGFRALIGTEQYNIASVSQFPKGATTDILFQVRLERRS